MRSSGDGVWKPVDNVGTARIAAQSANAAPLFIGIARHADVERFLAASAHDELTDGLPDSLPLEQRRLALVADASHADARRIDAWAPQPMSSVQRVEGESQTEVKIMIEQGVSPIEMVLDSIERDECLVLLRSQSIGRLAVADHGYYPPHIVPVNFTVDDECVVFRSNPGLKFKLSILAQHSVSFEVDSIDEAGRMAWSVVVQGRAELLSKEEAAAVPLGPLQPWAPGERQEWVRITPFTITGRRLRPRPVSSAVDA